MGYNPSVNEPSELEGVTEQGYPTDGKRNAPAPLRNDSADEGDGDYLGETEITAPAGSAPVVCEYEPLVELAFATEHSSHCDLASAMAACQGIEPDEALFFGWEKRVSSTLLPAYATMLSICAGGEPALGYALAHPEFKDGGALRTKKTRRSSQCCWRRNRAMNPSASSAPIILQYWYGLPQLRYLHLIL